MSVLTSVVEGWTGALGPFLLAIDGVPLNLTGMTVTLVLRRASGTLVTVGGTVTPMDQGTHPGRVMFAPAAGDFATEVNRYTILQMHQLHWKVVDSALKVVFFPNTEPDEIAVSRA